MFRYSSAKQGKIKKIQFGVLSPDIIRALSVAEIKHSKDYENDFPVENGIFDTRLGSTERTYGCTTCFNDILECPGHFGHIELIRPLYNIGFMKVVLSILRSVCFECSGLLINNDNDISEIMKIKKSRKRLEKIVEISRKIKCCGYKCEYIQPKFSLIDDSIIIEHKHPVEDDTINIKNNLSASKAHDIFKKISNKNCETLGLDPRYTRPEWLITTVLPVPPPQLRPSLITDGKRYINDLSRIFIEIIKTNNLIKQEELDGNDAKKMNINETLLQFYVSLIINSKIAGKTPGQEDNEILSIRQRLDGKRGRIRGNIMGKRVNFSARTVIGGDPTLTLNEVGIPKSIAMKLTVPEKVTHNNLTYMQNIVRNGPYELLGAHSIIKNDRSVIFLQKGAEAPEIQEGYTINRHLKNGDMVIFNRQPSLECWG